MVYTFYNVIIRKLKLLFFEQNYGFGSCNSEIFKKSDTLTQTFNPTSMLTTRKK